MMLGMKPCQLLASGVLGLRWGRGGLTHRWENHPGSRAGRRWEVLRLKEDLESRALEREPGNQGREFVILPLPRLSLQ